MLRIALAAPYQSDDPLGHKFADGEFRCGVGQ
jgi:hypothetical protein